MTTYSRRSDAVGTDTVALFNRHSLRTARELRGFTQTELAARVGDLTAASVSQLRTVTPAHPRQPSTGSPPSSTCPSTSSPPPSPPAPSDHHHGFFRSLRSTAPKDRRQARALVEVVRALTVALEAVTALPDLDLPRSPPGYRRHHRRRHRSHRGRRPCPLEPVTRPRPRRHSLHRTQRHRHHPRPHQPGEGRRILRPLPRPARDRPRCRQGATRPVPVRRCPRT